MLAGRGLVLRIPRARTSCARTRRRVGTTISASGKVIASRLSDIATRPPRLTDASAAAPLRAEPPARAARAAMRPPACRPARARRGKRRRGGCPRGTAMALDRENEAGAKAKAARGHFASNTSPTQSIPTGQLPFGGLGDGVRSALRSRAGTSRPTPGGFGTGGGLGERRRRDEREHEGNGRFHWVDLCLGHYRDTAGARH